MPTAGKPRHDDLALPRVDQADRELEGSLGDEPELRSADIDCLAEGKGLPRPRSVPEADAHPLRVRVIARCELDDPLARELSERLARLGYEGELADALFRWGGNENLEERIDGAERVDPVVLDELRRLSE